MRFREGARAMLNGLPPLSSQLESRRLLTAVAFGLLLSVALTVIIVFPTTQQVQLQEGDVSPGDIRAPRRIQFESDVLTAQERAAAARRVLPVYQPPDLRLTRQAVRRAAEVFETVEWARTNPTATLDEKRAMLRGVAELRDLPTDTLDLTLQATEAAWQRIKAETVRVVEAAMRQPIREDQIAEVRRSLSNYIGLSLSDAEAEAVAEYAARFIQPNALPDEAATQAARRAATTAVPATTRTVERGEIILRAGDIVQPSHLEVLQKLDLLQGGLDWRGVVGTFLLVTLSVFVLGMWVVYRNPDFWVDNRRAWLLSLVLLSFVLLAKLMAPGRTLMPYIFPGAAAAMLLTVLLEPRFALATTVLLALMVSLLAGRNFELFTYILLGGVIASLSLWHVERLMAFARAGIYVILAQIVVLLSFRLIRGEYDVVGVVELTLAAVASGVLATSLTTVGYYVLAHVFDLPTSIRLMELARPDQPLLRELQLKAPGTYHHSLVVSHMSEEAAHRVGADALLCRVGAYYHDVGKLSNPSLFIENQVDGRNPHDQLDPEISARYILAHSTEGVVRAQEAGLPGRLTDLIAEHHGTTLVRYFYARAVERANGGPPPDDSAFRYGGPRPQSKEAGILMLADSCEAAVRAKRPGSAEEIERVVSRVIGERLADNELDECPLTLREVEQVRAAFCSVLHGVYHPRVEYPPIVEPAAGNALAGRVATKGDHAA